VREKPTALLIDLDGVLRHFDLAVAAAAEARHGLEAGAVLRTAFAWGWLRPALTGAISHDEWIAAVATELGNAEAVAEWQQDTGTIDAQALAVVREFRAAGIPVVLVTNATDRLDGALAASGLDTEFDAVVNSSRIGYHKPSREFFASACAAAATPPARCLLLDDDDRNVRGARVAGLAALRYSGPADLGYLRAAFGLREVGVGEGA